MRWLESLKILEKGLPWRSSGWNSELPLQQLGVWSLIRELRSCMPHSMANIFLTKINSVQFSCWVESDSLQPHEVQHARPPCPSPTPGVHPDSCASSQWCHLAISSSVVPFSSYLQSLPASGTFPRSQLFSWGGQNIGLSASESVPSNEHPGLISFRMDWLYLLAVQGTVKSLLQYHTSKASILRSSAFFTVQLSHPYIITEKTIALGVLIALI